MGNFRMRKWLYGFAAIPLLGGQCFAEPTESVKKLINQPVSLFSFGLYKLSASITDRYDNRRGLELREPLFGMMFYGNSVTYDWDRNRIRVSLFRFNADATNWDFEEECKQVMRSLRSLALIDNNTGRPLEGIEQSAFASEFFPEGYSIDSIEKTSKEIDSIIELAFTASSITTVILITPTV